MASHGSDYVRIPWSITMGEECGTWSVHYSDGSTDSAVPTADLPKVQRWHAGSPS